MTILEAVILAGGEDKRLAPLTAPDQPKCLLPVANCPVLMYSLKSIKTAGVQSAIVVVCGADAANKVQNSLRKENLGSLKVQVVTVDSQSGSADAVRAVADRLRGDCVVVMSGDVVTDIPLNALVFNHNIRGASITSVLCKHRSSPAERTKVGKAPKGVDYVALDEKKGRLMSYAYDPQQLRSVQVCKAAIEACSPLNLTTEFRDACIYVLNKAVVEVIRKDAKLSSIKLHLLPKLVNEQWDPEMLSDRSNVRSDINEGGIADEARTFLADVSPEWGAMHQEVGDERFCGVYLVAEKHLCLRVNNVEALLDCNREVANFDAEHPLMPGNTLVHPTVEQGNKTTIASSCIVGEGSTLGDKTSIKRSVIGTSCKIGVNVKIINSVIMNGCVVGDGAHIQSSVLGHSVNIGSKVLLKECHVGHVCMVPDNEDLRGESFTSDKQS